MPVLAPPPAEAAAKFNKAKDIRGHEISGLWERNGRYYLKISLPGKGCRRVPLRDEQSQPARTISEAVAAAAELRKKTRQGELPVSQRAPRFNEYVKHYITVITAKDAKKKKTIKHEESVLNGWAEFLNGTKLNQITLRHIGAYVTQRKVEKISNRTVNLDVLTLNNCLKFARREGCLSGKLPTEGWERLPYKAPKRDFYSKETIEKICATAVALKDDGSPKYKNGELLADVLRFLRCSGARITSALATHWSDIDFERRQVHLRETKYDKQNIVVDFNAELEAHLRDMHARRQPDSDFLFPGTRTDGSVGSVRKSLELVRAEAGFPTFGFHDCRHTFISCAVMSGVDILTVAQWVGHADGGVLIGKAYGHLSSEHRQRAAQKVIFEQGAQTAPTIASALVDPSKLTPAELINLLHRSQQPAQPVVAAL
ncbi:MAG TPA: site-specific integrase [Verrucomicrobiae bacterium]|nr:site-specific integrase [Verrucomicrobiae bacterium]